MTITASMVKELRDLSGAGMMDAKKALTETNGNIDAAIDWLRTKGLATAAKKADRIAAEGLIAVAVNDGNGVLIEVNSETDFVAKNAEFQGLVRNIADAALKVAGDVAEVSAAEVNGARVDALLTGAIAKIGENMTFRRLQRLNGDVIGSYVHNAAADGMGKIGVLVALSGTSSNPDIGKQLAMHIAASSPLALSEETFDPAVLEHELAIQTAKALEENSTSDKPKPENVIQQHVIPGRMKRFLSENTLLAQTYIMNPDQTVKQAADEAGVKITGYIRMEVGEGIEKKEASLADEVAEALQG